MGEILGCLHWRAGNDGRDVEFVRGGASFSTMSPLGAYVEKESERDPAARRNILYE